MTTHRATGRGCGATAEYILQMLTELARMARRSDERFIAIHLEALVQSSKVVEKKGDARGH